ncbi:hypothetical protein GOQ27_04100 [Clostridium sp. D2Q-11]|uniref:Uncharacterized protein n=1 Tax=Anaeromonas frigoriresistens TaxID=2683708 RepID=A0A942UWE2_9FIRM|nr:hypothetical protein [Anaeromonas frigoriresistens]MBS4537631.1 hypothetical protein [Anaeromonas frigoriresistens]
MKTINKSSKIVFIILMTVLILFITNIYYPLRSYIIMYPVKTYYRNTGLFNDIPLKIPSGKISNKESFYPFVLYFNSNEGFKYYVDRDVDLSIMYNFGGFKLGKKNSSYFDPKSDYYSSFYGAYAIKTDNSTPFGFDKDKNINIDLLSKVPEYDQKYLVMSSIGLSPNNVTFDYNIKTIKEDIKYINSMDWLMVDSQIKTNAPVHKYKKHYNGYLQYGIPKELNNLSKDYPIMKLHGRMYIKYFKEYDSTIVFYILGKNKDIVDRIDENIVSKSYFKK